MTAAEFAHSVRNYFNTIKCRECGNWAEKGKECGHCGTTNVCCYLSALIFELVLGYMGWLCHVHVQEHI
jgi:hypothetical protein